MRKYGKRHAGILAYTLVFAFAFCGCGSKDDVTTSATMETTTSAATESTTQVTSKGEWVEEEDGTRYYDESGNYVKGFFKIIDDYGIIRIYRFDPENRCGRISCLCKWKRRSVRRMGSC